jgi:Polysaccharide lyase
MPRRLLPLLFALILSLALVPAASAATSGKATAKKATDKRRTLKAHAHHGKRVPVRKVKRGKGAPQTTVPAAPGISGETPVTTKSEGGGTGSASGKGGTGTTTPVTTPPVTAPTKPVVETPKVETPPSTPSTPVTEPPTPALFSSSAIRAFQVDHSGPNAVSEVSDPLGSGEKVIQMTVSDKDVYPITPTENPRAELISQPVVNPGQEVWLHTKFLIPSNYPTVPDGGWVSLVSFYGAPFNGPSPFHLEIDGNHLQWQRNGTYEWDVPYTAPLIKGQWVDVLVHEKFATEGFLELWINGEQINFFSSGGFNPHHLGATTKLEMATMDASNDAAPNAAKIMQYRKVGMFESGTIFFSGLQVGATRTSVGA